MNTSPIMSNWSDATEHPPNPECPFCGEDRQIERDGPKWVCGACSKEWQALTENDKRMLRAGKIEPK